jgi:hypothetical protein
VTRLTDDARAMRTTLDAIRRELRAARGPQGQIDVRAALRDIFEGEVEAPTADVVALKRRGTDADHFYETEVAPSWEGLDEDGRAARLDGFLELCELLDSAGDDAAGLPPHMAPAIRTKALVLAWAFDETHGYLARIAGRSA